MPCYDNTGLPLANCNECQDCQDPNIVGLPDCPPSSEACEDLLYSNCVKYVGPNLPTLGITSGMRLKEALVALDFKLLNGTGVANTYTVTVTSIQSKTTVEYISKLGVLSTIIVTKDNSPQSFCGLAGTPQIISGSGTVVNTNVTC